MGVTWLYSIFPGVGRRGQRENGRTANPISITAMPRTDPPTRGHTSRACLVAIASTNRPSNDTESGGGRRGCARRWWSALSSEGSLVGASEDPTVLVELAGLGGPQPGPRQSVEGAVLTLSIPV